MGEDVDIYDELSKVYRMDGINEVESQVQTRSMLIVRYSLVLQRLVPTVLAHDQPYAAALDRNSGVRGPLDLLPEYKDDRRVHQL